MHDDPVVRIVAKVLIPSIMLFAFYVQFHGDFGPGGGFQAGVIFASAFILHAIIFGLNRTRHVWAFRPNLAVLCVGVLLYGGTGILGMLGGGNFLNYNVLGDTPQAGQHLGILLVELGVGMSVAASMVMLFFAFAGRATHNRFLSSKERNDE
ncbi:MAG: Na(+)/H(+) antiporter subunit B [Alphaproteobacteria bacterium]|nr:Na(+)/H(+) antiporter subunit B [Alphaproteobacteria bacterium]MBE8220036.1 Na(+)/H(+) antiporter subunit B [Alphaproteobacteria bacterium]